MTFTEFYVQTTASNLNAGSTTADAAAFTYASGNWVAATGVFTVASGNPSSDGVAVGDFASVYADGSTVTGFVGRVTARDTTTITVSLTAKSGTAPTDGTGTRTLKIGGAWKGPNGTDPLPFTLVQGTMTNSTGNPPRINFKNGTNYAITAAMTHANAGPAYFQGYTTSVGDGGKAVIDGGTSGASYALLTLSGGTNYIEDFILQNNGASGTASGFVHSGNEGVSKGIVVNSVRGIGLTNSGAGTTMIECEAYSCNQGNSASLGGFINSGIGAIIRRCISHDNNNYGFYTQSGSPSSSIFEQCISDSNTNHGFSILTRDGCHINHCDSYNNGGDGIRTAANIVPHGVYIENCNLIKNGGYGINPTDSSLVNIVNCSFGTGTQANTSGTIAGTSVTAQSSGSVSYDTDAVPYNAPSTGDFRITLAAAKNNARGTFTLTQGSYTGTVAYSDNGAAQHLDTSGGFII